MTPSEQRGDPCPRGAVFINSSADEGPYAWSTQNSRNKPKPKLSPYGQLNTWGFNSIKDREINSATGGVGPLPRNQTQQAWADPAMRMTPHDHHHAQTTRAQGKEQEARNQKKEASSEKQEARSQKQETRSKKPEARNQKQKTRRSNQQPQSNRRHEGHRKTKTNNRW